MEPIQPLLIIILVLVLAVFAVFVVTVRKQGAPTEPNYRALFIIGITWLPLGVATGTHAFTVLGAVFLAVGLARRDLWEEERTWANLTEQERKLKMSVMGVLLVLFVLGFASYMLVR